jgi:hypothetical protein
MNILPATYCNTPAGSHVVHNWWKETTAQMATDDLLCSLAQDLLPAQQRPTIELVISKYQEQCSWILDWLPLFHRVTVYDKSDNPLVSPHPKITVVPLPNVGREGHTYAHHFVEHHDKLCDHVVCCQGDFTDHLSREDFDAMIRGKGRATLRGITGTPWSSTLMESYGWTPEDNHQTRQPVTLMQPTGMTMGKYFLTYIADDLVPEARVEWWPGAIFRVSASDVRRHSPEKYAAIRKTLEVGSNPEAGHYIERFWHALLA